MKNYIIIILKLLIFHCICSYFYQYTWLNFTNFDFDQTLYATYFGQAGVCQKKLGCINRNLMIILFTKPETKKIGDSVVQTQVFISIHEQQTNELQYFPSKENVLL
jgi:hypothetical protein